MHIKPAIPKNFMELNLQNLLKKEMERNKKVSKLLYQEHLGIFQFFWFSKFIISY